MKKIAVDNDRLMSLKKDFEAVSSAFLNTNDIVNEAILELNQILGIQPAPQEAPVEEQMAPPVEEPMPEGEEVAPPEEPMPEEEEAPEGEMEEAKSASVRKFAHRLVEVEKVLAELKPGEALRCKEGFAHMAALLDVKKQFKISGDGKGTFFLRRRHRS